jgi:hypothetical protein
MFNNHFTGCVAVLVGLAVGCTTDDTKPNATKTTTPSPQEDEMAATKTKQIWNAYIKYDDGDEKFAGKLAVENGMLSVDTAESDAKREYLQDAADDLNGQEQLVDVAPPKEADAPRYALGANEYTRDHPEFEKILARKLLENHDIRVEPAK